MSSLDFFGTGPTGESERMDQEKKRAGERQAMGAVKGEHPVARRPSQSRGQARVEAILDAAARIIAEEGLAAVTMHGLARRAQTSIGSLYHFFPDRDSVLRALIERHEAAVGEISRALKAIPPGAWQQLCPAEAIARLVAPYVDYVQKYPDYFALMHGRRLPNNSDNFICVTRNMLDARLPPLGSADRERYAVIFHAIASGIMEMAFVRESERISLYIKEVTRVLAAYLADIEAAIRG